MPSITPSFVRTLYLAALIACLTTQPRAENSSSDPQQTTDPAPQSSAHRAVIISKDRAVLSAEIAGKIIGTPYSLGDAFKAGDVLIKFDCTLQLLNLNKTIKDEDGSKRKWASVNQLAKMESTGRLNADLAYVEYKKAEAERASASTIVDRCQIKAPFDGRVVRNIVQNFENVNMGQPVIEIVGSKLIEIESAIPANIASGIKIGQRFMFHSDTGDMNLTGHLTGIAPIIEPVSQLVSVRGSIDNGGPVIIGATGTIDFEVVQ